MAIPRTRARQAYPGDRARILRDEAVDTVGRIWSPGDIVTPLSGGMDNLIGHHYLLCVEARFEAPRTNPLI